MITSEAVADWRRSFLTLPAWRRASAILASLGVLVATACTAQPSHGPGPVAGPPSPDLSIQSVAPSTPSLTIPPGASVPPARARACRSGDPLANVYHPQRLHIRSSCRTITGLVTSVRHEADGDYHVNVRLDPKYAALINDRNRTGEGGNLVVEIVPADEPGCTPGKPPRPPYDTYDFGVCTGADIPAPPTGARVSVTGPYVLDSSHGWMEIHPVWRLAILSGGGPAPGPSKPASSLRITSVKPNPVNPGQYETVTAQTSAGASCSITVTYASGTVSQAQGLDPKNASSSGRVSWTWKVGTRTGAGTAHARVACGNLSATASFRVT